MQTLTEILKSYSLLAVAFSGGTDSTLLASEAMRILGKDNVLLLHGESVLLPECDRNFTRLFREKGWNLQNVPFDPLAIPLVRRNHADRCYHCKKALFAALQDEARRAGFPVLADGTNADDLHDFRPGMKAAQELGVVHPFLLCGMTKKDIRSAAQKSELPNWDLPASACLASRIPPGTELSAALLRQIGNSESILSRLGFSGFRVRFENSHTARLEFNPAQFSLACQQREVLLAALAKEGFTEVLLDLRGYRPASWNFR